MATTRPARKTDLPALVRLLDQLYTIEPQFTPNKEKQRLGLEMALAHKEFCRIIVIENERNVVGMANVQFSVSTANGAWSAHIDDFVIDHAYRGKGLGRKLMGAVVEEADGFGATRVTVNADLSNAPAMAFYRKTGFETMNLVKHHKPISGFDL